jgi:hypothetical protein
LTGSRRKSATRRWRWYDYDSPKPFHVHTVLRAPHGNDYGRTWVRQWQERHGRD